MVNNNSNLSGIEMMKKRLQYHGGEKQQARMIEDKKWSMEHALYYSYQGADVQKIGDTEIKRALINPNKLKPDYDDKILSIDNTAGYKPGDVFDWVGTNTKWLIYLQNLTEKAYFRADIRKCSYIVNYVLPDDPTKTVKTTYLALRGPVETKIASVSKNGDNLDTPNYSLNFLMPKNEDTLKYFKRYSRFYLKLKEASEESLKTLDPICWRVEAVDTFSMPGVIEINAVEYYIDKAKDDIEHEIADDPAKADPIPEVDDVNLIKGLNRIIPKVEYEYEYVGEGSPEWEIDKKYPITIKTIENNKITVIWNKTYGGQFIIKCGDNQRTIIVDALF